jgi:pilus assembly protein CpaB
MMAGAPEKKARSAELGKGRLRALLYLAAAVLAALGTAVLLTRYMDTRVAAVRVPTEKVVVAAMELPIATELELKALATVDWPAASLPEGTAKDPKDLEGRIVNATIAKGEPILLSRLASEDDTGKGALSTVLSPGMRAMSVRVDDVVGVAGFIHPGDHVDVIVTMSPDLGSSPPVSKIILQYVKVLTVGQELEGRAADPQKPVPATVATLMVDSDQAERLALAASKGQLVLALRSSIDTETVATAGVAPKGLLSGSAAIAERPRLRRSRRVEVMKQDPPPPPDSKMVEILRGDMFEKRDFQKDGNP